MASSTSSATTSRVDDFISFLNDSPTPFHAVHNAVQRLERAGFHRIHERDSWAAAVKPGGKYFLTRNGSTLVAFVVGRRWAPGNPIAMIGSHTDSCCLRLKPASKLENTGYLQVAVEPYGGGLWHTWFDRDLSIAGRVMVKDLATRTVKAKLVDLKKPLLRIPTLAIHFGREETFAFNKETQLLPIAGLVAEELKRIGSAPEPSAPDPTPPLKPLRERHHAYILDLLAKTAAVDASDIVDFELVLYDTQKAVVGGLNDELVFSARLDNLGMTYCTVEGLIASASDPAAAVHDQGIIRLAACFDHEEVGSKSAQGADSNILPAILRRLSLIPADADASGSDASYERVSTDDAATATAYEQTLARSFLVSADMAHAAHPNYPAKNEPNHKPEMNKGTVVKVNANARYMTNTPGMALMEEVARRARPSATVKVEGVPLQLFVVRNDVSCGSTIGPMLAAALGARTLDLGNAQLSMHSIRETAGAHDVAHGVDLFESFYRHYEELGPEIMTD